MLRFAMPESAARSVRAGAQVYFKLDGQERTGVVLRVAPELDAAAKLVLAEAAVEPAAAGQLALRAGLEVTVRLAR